MAYAERALKCDRFGIHRVLDQAVVLPQAAEKLDNSLPIFNNEILIEVDRLNIDAASFIQMEKQVKGNSRKLAKIILNNIDARGKQQNPVTGSGGMLIGTIKQVGSHYKGPIKLKVGTKVATLISLTSTPLFIEQIEAVDFKSHQIKVKGYAILFESSILTPLPQDLPELVAMAALDVAGAPALAYALPKKNQSVVLLGAGGKAGLLSAVAARKKIGPQGTLIAIEPYRKAADELKSLKVCDKILRIDATDPIAVMTGVAKLTHGKMGNVVLSVASVPGTEMSAVLSTSSGGKSVFFSMASSFSKIALGAESVASTATLIVGNGYYPKHAAFTLELLRSNAKLREIFINRYN